MKLLSAVADNPIELTLLAAAFGVCGQLSLKVGISHVEFAGITDPVHLVLSVLSAPLVLGGLFMYGAGAAVWLVVLSRSALSFAYPILAISYAITPVLACVLLGESINSQRWLGIAAICLGVLVVARS